MPTANGHATSPSLPPVDWAKPHDDAVQQLERQLVRGSHFAQAALDKLLERLARTEATLAGLLELLQAAGLVVEDDAEPSDAVTEPAPPDDDSDDPSMATPTSWPAVAFGTEPEEPDSLPEVDCAERMHICHAVCCKLSFALTPPEVEVSIHGAG